jgi:hypothetical protein
MTFIVRIECLILLGHLSLLYDFIRRCNEHADKEGNLIILQSIRAVQTSILHGATLSCEVLHNFLVWSTVVADLRQVVKYAISFGIPSGFTKEDIRRLNCALPCGVLLPQILSQYGREIVLYHISDPFKPKLSLSRRCKNVMPTLSLKKKPVHNNFKDCCNFHIEGSSTPLISTFSSLPLPSHGSSTENLIYFSNRTDILRLQYDIVLQQDVEDRNINLCELIIADSESLLAEEDRLLSLSTSHRKYLREKLRKAITQVRTILQEAVAYDSSQLLNSANNANTILHYFNRCQPNKPDLSMIYLDNKEHPD